MINGIEENKLTKYRLDELLAEIESRCRYCVILCDNPSNLDDVYFTILKGSLIEKAGAIQELKLLFEHARNND